VHVANPDAIDWYPLSDMDEKHIDVYRMMLEIHTERTGSQRASELLKEWPQTLSETLMIVPKEIADRVFGEKEQKKAS